MSEVVIRIALQRLSREMDAVHERLNQIEKRLHSLETIVKHQIDPRMTQ